MPLEGRIEDNRLSSDEGEPLLVEAGRYLLTAALVVRTAE